METIKNSFIYNIIVKIIFFLKTAIINSFVYKVIISFCDLLENTIRNSGIYNWLTKEVDNSKKNEESLITKIIYGIINIVRKIFEFCRLDKILANSILGKTYIWIGIVVALAPFVPTMTILYVVLFTFLSFIIKVCLDKDFKFKYTPVNSTVLIFLLVYAFCAITSIDPSSSIKIGMLVGSFILFYFIIINSIETKKEIKGMIYVFLIAGVFVSLYGIYQYIFATFYGSTWVDKELFENLKIRVYSTLENPNVLGEYLLLVIPLGVSMFFANKGVIKKSIIFLLVCVMAICLVLTYSRGCYLGLIFAACVYVILLNFKFILLFIAGLLSMPFVLPKSVINRFTSIGNMEDTSTSYRVSIWVACVEMIKKYWYMPLGQGEVAFNKIYPLYAQREVGAPHSHNLFLQTIIETGIVGIICFVILIFKVFQYLFSGLKKVVSFSDKVYLIGFISGLSGYMVQSVFDNTWYNYRVVLIFWMFISMAVTYRKNINKEEKLLND